MKVTSAKCKVCGWWDIGMKYGLQRQCTQCGAPLAKHTRDRNKRNVPLTVK